ncbi:hypothetical protein [Loktanella sp. S4079]|uniref:hypothetical protein n=1 Tax=Loktanella sp. S4079 TaxID=579483 RepID=UPI0005FA31A9|nr:hypothetical protein [Loktanella sp. S4079]KJZ21162.1 hypothetical protein TW80_00445 [Loktanella sp. S4079]
MSHALALESFDHSQSEKLGPSAEFQAGYAEGMEAAQETAAMKQQELEQSALQQLADVEFTFAEARNEVLSALTPLLNAIMDQILPELLADNFGPRVVELLTNIVNDQIEPLPLIAVHPSQSQKIAQLVASHSARASITEDADLNPHQIWISTTKQELAFDSDVLLAQIRDTMHAITISNDRMNQNG